MGTRRQTNLTSTDPSQKYESFPGNDRLSCDYHYFFTILVVSRFDFSPIYCSSYHAYTIGFDVCDE